MKSIEVYYASAPVDQVAIHTLEIKNVLAYAAGESNAVIRLADGFYTEQFEGEEGVWLGLESGSREFFRSSAFGISLPAKSVKGVQNLNFQIDNVTGQSRKFIDRALEMGSKISLVYRVYLSSNLTEPAKPPLELTCISETDNQQTIGVVASFHDLVNRAWPRRRYTPEVTTGLKYQGS